jgi:carboxy-cis,cis-muconate cyclase
MSADYFVHIVIVKMRLEIATSIIYRTCATLCRGQQRNLHVQREDISKMPAIQNSLSTVHHLLTGSYTNHTLFLLAFDTIAKTLNLQQQVPAFGLHQFVTTNAARDRVYATTMSEPPQLFSWSVGKDYSFTHLNTVNICKRSHSMSDIGNILTQILASTSCYFSDDGSFAYTASGPTAQIHTLNDDGSLGNEIQQMIFVPQEEFKNVNKTRAANVGLSSDSYHVYG